MKVGDLVRYHGTIGIVTRKVTAKWAEKDDVWVLWSGALKPKVENGKFLEVLNENR